MAPTPVLFGDYLLLQRTAIGGMAEVFRAQRRGRPPGEADVALKRLLPPWLDDPAASQLFFREIEALRRIDDPAVVRLLDAGTVHGVAYVVMPWLGGASLRQVLQPAAAAPSVPLSPQVTVWLGARLAAALAAAHRAGVVHRDVSPTNIQIDAAGQPHLIDFGIARVTGLAQTTAGGSARGKWAYAAPEQLAGLALDGRTDLFALGAVLAECLLGVPPFADADREATLSRIRRAEPLHWPELPPPWHAAAPLLRALVARDPAGRPSEAGDVAAALQELATACGDASGQQARHSLATRVAAVQPREDAPIDAAELRGEDVTRPDIDADATQVRLDG